MTFCLVYEKVKDTQIKIIIEEYDKVSSEYMTLLRKWIKMIKKVDKNNYGT